MFDDLRAKQEEKAKMLQAYLNVAGKRTKIVEEALKTASVDLENGIVSLDKSKLAAVNEELIKPKGAIKEVFELTRGAHGSKRPQGASPDQINALLTKGAKAARNIPASTQQPQASEILREDTHEQSEGTDRINALLNGNHQPSPKYEAQNAPQYNSEPLDKKLLREEFIKEMATDKEVRLEIMEMVVFELLGKDRVKRLIREILTEAKEAKK